MAGSNHPPPPPPSNALRLRQVPLPHPLDDRRLPANLATTAPRPHHHASVTILEDRIAIQHREIQTLLLDNQRLASTHVALKQDLALAEQDILQLSAVAADVKAERENQVRELYEKSFKLDAEVRSIDATSAELVQVRADIQKLSVDRRELSVELQAINDELVKAKKDAQQVPKIKAEIEAVQREVQRGRAAIECEKKNRASNLEQGQIMEKYMIALTREIKRLRAELANAEERARAAATATNPNPGYAGNFGNTEVGYGGSPYPVPYGMNQVQGSTDSGPPIVSGALPSGPCEGQQTHQ